MKFGVKNLLSSWQSFSQKTKLRALLLAAFLLLAVGAGYSNSRLPKGSTLLPNPFSENKEWQKYEPAGLAPPYFILQAKSQGEYGVLPQETYTLTSAHAVSQDFIKDNLKSNVDYSLKPISDTVFEIITSDSVKTDQIVTFSLPVKDQSVNETTLDRNYSWTFQTQPKFQIVSILPGDKKTNVPKNTGIELIFNQDGFRDPTEFISITPKIDWKGERHGSTFAIVPQNSLNYETVYTVTLKKGLDLENRRDPIDSDTVFSFQTEQESTAQNNPYLFLAKNFIQTSTKNPAAVNVWSNNLKNDSAIKAKIFKFSGSSQFIESRKKLDQVQEYWYRNYDDTTVNTSNLSKISQVDLKIQTQDDASFLQLPEALPSGFYLVQFSYEGSKKPEQLWLQSTDVSAYTSVGRRQTLVWANDPSTGQPIGEALISPGNSSTYQTSSNGVSVFETPSSFFDKSVHYLKVSAPLGELLLPVNSLSGHVSPSQKDSNDYWSYLYHERTLYKPGDTMYFWGVIKNRETNQPPASVDIEVNTGSDDRKKPIAIKVTPDSDGSFMGSLVLKDIPADRYYQLSLNVDSTQIASSGFQLTQYEKPELKIEVTADKIAAFAGDKVEFTAQVSFYDGTPAKNVPLVVRQQYGSKTEEVKTDKNGQIKYTYVPEFEGNGGYYTNYPRYESITITSGLVNNDKLEAHGSVYVFGEKLSITQKPRQEGDRAFVSAQVNKITLDNLNQKISQNTLGALVPNQQVKLLITKTWWEKKEDGTYYDFVEKVTRKSYRYDQKQEKLADTNLKTDQNGLVNYQFTMEEGKSYKVELTLQDPDNHPVTSVRYYYYYQGQQYNSDDKFATPKLVLNQKENRFSLGDKVDLNIKYKDQNYPDTDQNKFLFILSQKGRQDFFVEDKPQFSFEFDKKHIPNTSASAIIFSGNHYQIATPSYEGDDSFYYWSGNDDTYFSSLFLGYDSDDSKLSLSISSDKKEYTPGDKAKVTVNVKKGDSPVVGAQVHLVLVDQAMEALGGIRQPNILGDLYSSVSNQIYYNYYSHKPLAYQPPAAEKGGGGGGDSREIFKDTPFFGQSRTNAEGRAEFEFDLPDNITTWVIYSQALSSEIDAGQSESALVATKKFFVTSNYPKEILTNDLAFVSGNGFGKDINSNQPISYEVKFLEDDLVLSTLTSQGKSSLDTQFAIPKLSVGDYKVWLKGSSNNLSDGLILPFSVTSTRLKLSSSQKIDLEKGQSIKELSLPGIDTNKQVKVVISDIGYGKYFHQLNRFCFTGSNRIEKLVAQAKAGQLLKDKFDDDYCIVSPKEISAFKSDDGGLSQVEWGSSDLETTVWALYVDPDVVDKKQMVSYFERYLSKPNLEPSNKAYALWGLTLAGKPKINELKALYKNTFSYKGQVVIGLALASAGDLETSQQIYQDIVANHVYFNKPYYRIQATGNATPDTTIYDTSLALLLGNLVNDDLNQGYNLYLDHYGHQANDLVLDLSQIAYLDSEISSLPIEDSQATVTTSGSRQVVNLSKGRSKVIRLDGSKVQGTSITADKGKVEVNSVYSLSSSAIQNIPGDDRLSIKRNYSEVEDNDSAIKPGDIVAVRIDLDLNRSTAPQGCYTVIDHVPSGLTVIDNPYLYGLAGSAWVNQKSHNVVEFAFCNSDWWWTYGQKHFVYYTRASAIGTYVAEPAILQSKVDLSIIKSTSEDKIKIEAVK